MKVFELVLVLVLSSGAAKESVVMTFPNEAPFFMGYNDCKQARDKFVFPAGQTGTVICRERRITQ